MDYKIVVSDVKTGKSYQVTVKDDDFKKVRGMKIGDVIDGGLVGLSGYKLEITGGTDKAGFAMRKGVHGWKATRILIGASTGYRPSEKVRIRKRVHGEAVEMDVSQLNTKVAEYGKKSIEESLGVKPEEKKEGSEEKKADKKEKK